MEHKEYSEEIDFQKYWLVLKRRWFPTTVVFSAVVALTAVATSLQEPVYQATGKLLFKTDQTSSLTGLEAKFGELDTLAKNSNPLITQAEIIRSKPIAETTIKALDLKDEEGEFLGTGIISQDLSVKPVTDTDILQISYESDDPELAAAVVNQLMKVYIENNVKTNRAEAVAARDFIFNKGLPEAESEVSKAEIALKQFKEENKVLVLEEEASAAVSAIANVDREITDAQAELAQISARSAELRRQVGMDSEESVDISSLNQAPGVQDALTELQKVQSELATQRTRYRSGHPAIAQLERQEAALQALVQQRVGQVLGRDQPVPVGSLQIGELRQSLIQDYVRSEIERLGLIRRISELSRAQTAYQERSSALPRLEKAQRELERKLEAAQTTYETLLSRLQEIQVAENQNVGNARVIAEADVPGLPIAPRKVLNMAAGGIAGILLSIATAFLLDITDRSVKTLKEARELFGYTLLGVIPYVGKPGKFISLRAEDDSIPRVVIRESPNFPVQEAYQMLQANLKFLSSDKELRTIVVTSSVRREGKSEVSANLAAALAQMKRRVLLVDADMRHPTQHHAWDLTNINGLSNLIVGQVKFSEAVQVVMPNLHVLTCGVVPPNPMVLLDSARMASLIEIFSKNYDFVIFDAPALAGIVDAAILGKMTDGILLVVRPGVVNSASANAAKEFLAQSGQNVLGVVVNGVNVKSESDSYFYYIKQEQVLLRPDHVPARF
jgi:polysaccharide biosynthesis transport protein